MKTEKNIQIAFLLNLGFSIFELIGGSLTGSVAILSDAVHDLGDALSIGVSYQLEKKSKKAPDQTYTYGYGRYSVIGSMMTTMVLLVGSGAVIVGAFLRLLHPVEIQYNGMILMALFGVGVNSVAAFVTREGDSLNQRAVNLHMLEDVLGWVVILVGAVIMRFTNWRALDPILSICVSGYVLYEALKNMKRTLDVFLERTPEGVNTKMIEAAASALPVVQDVHHVHLWTLDGACHIATLHVVTEAPAEEVKPALRHTLKEIGIGHTTIEIEKPGERCTEIHCAPTPGHLHGAHKHHGHCHCH